MTLVLLSGLVYLSIKESSPDGRRCREAGGQVDYRGCVKITVT